ncbi:hypothetical protein GCM10022226_26780 [Sphaerisporangium flaviroseum]|uniref:Transcription-repair-coupling factor C-terminal domain-containing protein n=1 Tax=Sphaerisporangium flaviroseum TaxID=509199 RepID=A0ABP7HXH1_9ACTN
MPLAEGAEERFAATLTTLGRMLRARGMGTLLVRRVGLRLRLQKEPGATTYHSPEMTVGMPGDPRTARVTVERGRCGPTLHIAFPEGGMPRLRLRATDLDLAVSLLRQLFDTGSVGTAGSGWEPTGA